MAVAGQTSSGVMLGNNRTFHCGASLHGSRQTPDQQRLHCSFCGLLADYPLSISDFRPMQYFTQLVKWVLVKHSPGFLFIHLTASCCSHFTSISVIRGDSRGITLFSPLRWPTPAIFASCMNVSSSHICKKFVKITVESQCFQDCFHPFCHECRNMISK